MRRFMKARADAWLPQRLDTLAPMEDRPEQVGLIFRRRVRGTESFVLARLGSHPVTFSSLAQIVGVFRTSGYRDVEAVAKPHTKVHCACSGRCSEGRPDYELIAIPPVAA